MIDLLLLSLIVAGTGIVVCEINAIKRCVSRLDAHINKVEHETREKDCDHGR